MADDIKKIASEALELHRKIASDNKRLLDLKKQISEASVGRNSSYKIPLDKGTVRINMVKESLNYSFDQEGFNKLDNQIKDKFLEEEVVKKDLNYSFDQEGFKKLDNQIKDKLFEEEVIKENLNYSLNKNKIETIKSESEFKDLNNLITESKRDAHFAVSFWQSKNNAPIEESLNQKENIIENNKEESFIKKWVKKIF